MIYELNLSKKIYPINDIKDTISDLQSYVQAITLKEEENISCVEITSEQIVDVNEFMNYLLDKVSSKELN